MVDYIVDIVDMESESKDDRRLRARAAMDETAMLFAGRNGFLFLPACPS